MISHYFREQERYTKSDIIKALGISEDNTVSVLKKLKEYGIVKTTRGDKKDLSDLLEDNEEISDVETSGNQIYYVFVFVGVITIKGIVLKVYPKYLSPNTPHAKEFKQVVSVLKEYNKRKAIVRIYNESEEGHSFNLLAIMLYLMQDYWDNGVYSNTETVIESNGPGDIIWERTINDSFAYIQRNKPYYIDVDTRKTKVDDYDFFKRLHECILTEISNELKSTKAEDDEDDFSLLDLFELEEIDLTDEKRDAFGDQEYLLYKIEKELSVQFNTKKQNTLKILYTYISQNNKFTTSNCLSLFGTTGYHKVWEDVCASILDSQLQKKLGDIIPGGLKDKFVGRENEKLIDLIEKPHWDYVVDAGKWFSPETLEPDLISVVDSDQGRFLIFDAKYYSPTIEVNTRPQNIPGVSDITKQYLYELAYMDFIKAHDLFPVANCFLIPSAGDDIVSKGHVVMSFLRNLGLKDVQIRMLPAKLAYSLYVSGKKLDIALLKLDTTTPSVKTVHYSYEEQTSLMVAEEPDKYGSS